MNTARDKFLTEAMGECWHEDGKKDHNYTICSKCSWSWFNGLIRPDFSVWHGFGKLKEYISTTDYRTEFWIYFFDKIEGALDSVDDLFDGIYPDNLANIYYEFLKSRESEV